MIKWKIVLKLRKRSKQSIIENGIQPKINVNERNSNLH